MESLSQLITTHHWGTHFVNSTPPMYGLAQCFQDLSHHDCLLCYAACRTKIPRCLPSLSATIFLDGCYLRYDNYSFYQQPTDPSRDAVICSSSSKHELENEDRMEFVKNVGFAIRNVTKAAVDNGGFGVAQVKGSVYALAQCWKTVGRDGCRACLEKGGEAVRGCAPKKEGRALNAGCYLRYSTEKFYMADHGHGLSVSRGIIIAVVLAAAAFILLSLFAAYAGYAKLVQIKQERSGVGLASISINKYSSLKFKYETLEKATDYFNSSRKLGKEEHKHLVKFLGCSIEGPESLLVYEYVPNRSLDHFLFDKNKVQILTWNERLNIIVGTAEGLAYLHEDFGLARCFAADKSHLSTGIAGTLGYMAPEYLVQGQLTEKADVYSFGVLVLEIVSGKRNSTFRQDWDDSDSLLHKVWKLYISNDLARAVDPCLRDDFPVEEASRVLQIGLLCTQASVALRPSMAEVVAMLTNKERAAIPNPNQPPFLNATGGSTINRSYSANSSVSNALTKVVASCTSTESSSMPSSYGDFKNCTSLAQ
ncbi:cysteine-rich receptor-like protein kinase 42 [Prunus yedoensis var. nudiflora]|uniref:Cysteine-rich receptor-like protein kinase 42 n=1 Tax=Prunus yedoensis var. nudiflora TaxID=2094558 RepID=A0A314Z912_PRUYE|nr:cysteine-rich receptor-like protein kinase 42 [Prunus yedoensis var. nudiflora]